MAESPARPSIIRRWLRRLKRVLVIGLVTAGIIACLLRLHLWREHRKGLRDAEAAERRLDEIDPGWRWADLNVGPTPSPERDLLAKFLGVRVNGFYAGLPPMAPWRTEDGKPDAPHRPIDVKLLDEIRTTLLDHAESVAAARGLEGCGVGDPEPGGRPRPVQVDMGKGPRGLAACADAPRLLACDAESAWHVGDSGRGWGNIWAALDMATALASRPVRLGWGVEAQAEASALAQMQRSLGRAAPVPAADLTRAQERLNAMLGRNRLRDWIRHERAAASEFLKAADAGAVELQQKDGFVGPGGPWVAGFFAPGARADLLAAFTLRVEMAELPEWQRAGRANELDRDVREFPRVTDARGWVGYALMMPAARQVEHMNNRRAHLACAVVGLAAERFRLESGRWPETAAELVPRYLDAVPIGPHDGKPIELARVGDGLVARSGSAPAPDPEAYQSRDRKPPERPRFTLIDPDKRAR